MTGAIAAVAVLVVLFFVARAFGPSPFENHIYLAKRNVAQLQISIGLALVPGIREATRAALEFEESMNQTLAILDSTGTSIADGFELP